MEINICDMLLCTGFSVAVMCIAIGLLRWYD